MSLHEEVGQMPGATALPRDNGELVFAAPWEGRALALAVTVVDRLGLTWEDFRRRLVTAIQADQQRPYYESWAQALEQLLLDHAVTTTDELDAATPSERSW